jgi:hypothetical protein
MLYAVLMSILDSANTALASVFDPNGKNRVSESLVSKVVDRPQRVTVDDAPRMQL